MFLLYLIIAFITMAALQTQGLMPEEYIWLWVLVALSVSTISYGIEGVINEIRKRR